MARKIIRGVRPREGKAEREKVSNSKLGVMEAAWNVGDKFKVQTQDSGGSNHFCGVGASLPE